MKTPRKHRSHKGQGLSVLTSSAGNSGFKQLTFHQLVRSICSVHEKFSVQVARSINRSLTLRNWMIGLYIAEFELNGADRAKYGENLFKELSVKLVKHEISGCGRRQLYNDKSFY